MKNNLIMVGRWIFQLKKSMDGHLKKMNHETLRHLSVIKYLDSYLAVIFYAF